MEPYLYECVELGKLDCIQQVIIHVTDERSYSEELFAVAESFFAKGFNKEELILFECVADRMRLKIKRTFMQQPCLYPFPSTPKMSDNNYQ